MTFKRRLLAGSTLTILAILIGLAFFALPTHRRAAATTYFILTPTPSLTPPPLTIGDTLDHSGQPRLPIIENMLSRLLFVYRFNLYLAAFDGQPAQLIAQDVRPSAVQVAPDQRSFVYWVQRMTFTGVPVTIVNLVNLDTLTTSTLTTFQHRVSLIRWSADGAWLALDLDSIVGDDFSPLGVLIASRTEPVPPTQLEDFTAATWLSDNRLLITGGTAESTEFAIFDPTSGDITTLDIPAEQIPTLQGIRSIYSPDYAAARDILTALDLHPVWTPTYTFAPDLGVAPDASQWVAGETTPEVVCQPYQVVRHTVADNSTTVLAEFSDPYTLRLSNFQWAADNSLYFVRWSSRTCPADLGQSTVQLYRLAANEAPIQLGDNLLTEVFLHTYDVSPDGNLVAWVGYEGQSSFVATTDVVSGEQQRLMTLTTATYPTGFTSVWWLP